MGGIFQHQFRFISGKHIKNNCFLKVFEPVVTMGGIFQRCLGVEKHYKTNRFLKPKPPRLPPRGAKTFGHNGRYALARLNGQAFGSTTLRQILPLREVRS